MKVAFLAWRHTSHPLAGGAEVLVDRLATGLLRRGHEVAVLAGGPVPADAPYEVAGLGGTYTQYLRAPFVHARGYRDWDVVVDSENGLPFFSPLWRRGPVLTLVHHVHLEQWAQRFPPPVAAAGRLAERHAFPAAYRRRPFVTVSESTRGALAGIGIEPERVAVLPVGTDPPPPAGARSPEPLFVALGRLVPHKRVDLLLRAWERVRPVTGGRLVVIGDGPERDRLRGLAGPGAEIVGRVDEETKWRLLSDAWLLVHPAQHEGWGMVVLEAGAAGTPTLGFRVPGVRDAVVDDVSGVLVEPGPDPEGDLAAAWIRLVADSGRLDRLSASARDRAAARGWDATVAALDDLLARVAGGG